MKHFHGRRHIRARNSVKAGRLHRQIHKLERYVNNLGYISAASGECAYDTKALAKVLVGLMKPYAEIVEKWRESYEPTL